MNYARGTPDVEELYKKQIQINVKEILKDIDTKEMRLKISNWADKFGYDFEEIKEKVIWIWQF